MQDEKEPKSQASVLAEVYAILIRRARQVREEQREQAEKRGTESGGEAGALEAVVEGHTSERGPMAGEQGKRGSTEGR